MTPIPPDFPWLAVTLGTLVVGIVGAGFGAAVYTLIEMTLGSDDDSTEDK